MPEYRYSPRRAFFLPWRTRSKKLLLRLATIAATSKVVLTPFCFVCIWKTYPVSERTFSIRFRTSGETFPRPFRTRSTVPREVFAKLAISLIVIICVNALLELCFLLGTIISMRRNLNLICVKAQPESRIILELNYCFL